jgi:hypothetical protein
VSGGSNAMLKHEWYHFAILRRAVSGHRQSEHLGWTTTLGSLGQLIREAGLDETGRDPMDALMQLHGRKAVVLRKIQSDRLSFTTYDYEEYPEQNKFFWGEFGLYVTPEGSAYFNELEAKAYAEMQPATPQGQNKIGFRG